MCVYILERFTHGVLFYIFTVILSNVIVTNDKMNMSNHS